MVKVGVIGLGYWGPKLARNIHELPEAELAWVCDFSADRLAHVVSLYPGVRATGDYRELLASDVDAVVIATPVSTHHALAMEAVRAGKHVLVEKPLEVTVEGGLEMVDAAEQRNLLLQVDFHKRYDPYHIELQRMIADGKLGDPLYGYVHMEDRVEVPRDWFPHWANKSSPIWFLGVHFYDLIRWVMNSDGRSVFARGQKRKLVALGVDTYDSVQAQVEFMNGAVVTFDTSWILPEQFEAIVNQGLRLVGTEGMIEVDSQDRGARSCFARMGMQTHNLGFLRETTDRSHASTWLGYGIESIADFGENVAFLLAGGKLEQLAGRYPTGRDGLAVTKIACAVDQSLRSGAVVSIE